jgi:hypothetical protein
MPCPDVPPSPASGAATRAACLPTTTRPTSGPRASLRSKRRHSESNFREDLETESEFVTVSYWDDIASMSDFTGGDPNKVHHLPRDREFLIELPNRVQVLRILVDQQTNG